MGVEVHVSLVFPLQIEDRIDVVLELGREHLDGAHKPVRIYLRRVIGEAEDLEAGLDGIFHVLSLRAVGVPAAPCMGVIICDHRIVSPFIFVRSDSGSFSLSGVLCIKRFNIVVPDLIEPVKFLVRIENECEEQ